MIFLLLGPPPPAFFFFDFFFEAALNDESRARECASAARAAHQRCHFPTSARRATLRGLTAQRAICKEGRLQRYIQREREEGRLGGRGGVVHLDTDEAESELRKR